MATIKKGILGGVSGKVGNVVGGSWKGVDYLRSLPAEVRQANSTLQISQRMKFKAVIDFLKPLNELIRIGFKPDSAKMTAFNAAMSYNYNNALTGDFESGFSIDYAKALVARGNLAGIAGAVIESANPGQLSLNWTDNSAETGAAATDILYVGVYNPDKGTAVVRINSAQRATGTVTIDLPADYSGDLVQCYAGFLGTDVLVGTATRETVSTSIHMESVVVA